MLSQHRYLVSSPPSSSFSPAPRVGQPRPDPPPPRILPPQARLSPPPSVPDQVCAVQIHRSVRPIPVRKELARLALSTRRPAQPAPGSHNQRQREGGGETSPALLTGAAGKSPAGLWKCPSRLRGRRSFRPVWVFQACRVWKRDETCWGAREALARLSERASFHSQVSTPLGNPPLPGFGWRGAVAAAGPGRSWVPKPWASWRQQVLGRLQGPRRTSSGRRSRELPQGTAFGSESGARQPDCPHLKASQIVPRLKGKAPA